MAQSGDPFLGRCSSSGEIASIVLSGSDQNQNMIQPGLVYSRGNPSANKDIQYLEQPLVAGSKSKSIAISKPEINSLVTTNGFSLYDFYSPIKNNLKYKVPD